MAAAAATGAQEDRAERTEAAQEARAQRDGPHRSDTVRGTQMSKGMNQKKNTKKKAAKSLMEKRAAKA
jgi:hypothetical protein